MAESDIYPGYDSDGGSEPPYSPDGGSEPPYSPDGGSEQSGPGGYDPDRGDPDGGFVI